MRNLRKEAVLAQELKRNALNDLSNIKEEIKRQHVIEQLRQKELNLEQNK